MDDKAYKYYSDFQKMIIQINSLFSRMQKQTTDQKIEFEDMQLEFIKINRMVAEMEEDCEIAKESAEQALQIAQSFQETLNEINIAITDQNNAINILQTQISEI